MAAAGFLQLPEAALGGAAGLVGLTVAVAVRRGVGHRWAQWVPGPSASTWVVLAAGLVATDRAPAVLLVGALLAAVASVQRAARIVEPLFGAAALVAGGAAGAAGAAEHGWSYAGVAIAALAWVALARLDRMVARVLVVGVCAGLFVGVPDTELATVALVAAAVPASWAVLGRFRPWAAERTTPPRDAATASVVLAWLVPTVSLDRAPLVVGGWGLVGVVIVAWVATVLAAWPRRSSPGASFLGSSWLGTAWSARPWPVIAVAAVAMSVIARVGMVRAGLARSVVTVAVVAGVQLVALVLLAKAADRGVPIEDAPASEM